MATHPGPHVHTHARNEFYAEYQREADDHDREFLKKYEDDLNTSLIFAGLFSAVTTAFIIDVQSNLQPDYNEVTAALVRILIHKLDNTTFPGIDLTPPEWNGPPQSIVAVQSILYASLVASLIGAFLAMLGKQWLNRYSQMENRSSIIDRCRERQQKWDGIEQWHFHTVMESLPLMLQIALLLLGCALSRYLWDIQQAVAAVVICATAFGVLIYITVVLSAISSRYCPFQTPLSILLRSWLVHATQSTSFQHFSKRCQAFSFAGYRKFQQLLMRNFDKHPSDVTSVPLFHMSEVDLDGHFLDARCVAWSLNQSTNANLTRFSIQMVPEISWHPGISAIPPLPRFNESLQNCFDTPALTHLYPGARDQAYESGKALCHLWIQSVHAKDAVIQVLEPKFQQYDGNLNSLLRMLANKSTGKAAHGFALNNMSVSHLSWMCRTLLLQMSRNDDVLIVQNVNQFVVSCLDFRPYPPTPMVADCLLIISCMSGYPIDVHDTYVQDKSKKLVAIIACLEEHLLNLLSKNPILCVEAMDLLSCWRCKPEIEPYHYKVKLSHRLFSAIIESGVDGDLKWKAAAVALQMSYRNTGVHRPQLLPIPAPHIMTFLRNQLSVVDDGDSVLHDSIADALKALSLHDASAGWASELTSDHFIAGICSIMRAERPLRLRVSAMTMVYHFRKEIFKSQLQPSMHPEYMLDFFSRFQPLWEDLPTDSDRWVYIGILARLAKSPVWHPHLRTHSAHTLQSFFRRYDEDTHVNLSDHDSLDTTSFILLLLQRFDDFVLSKTLLEIVWKRFKELYRRPGALEQIVEATVALSRREGGNGMGEIKSLVENAQRNLDSDSPGNVGPDLGPGKDLHPAGFSALRERAVAALKQLYRTLL